MRGILPPPAKCSPQGTSFLRRMQLLQKPTRLPRNGSLNPNDARPQQTVIAMNTGAYDVLSEHQHIRRLVDTLESTIEKRDANGSDWLEELRPVLIELSSGLASHFQGEEAELFEDVKRRLPRHVPTVERLVEQHRQLSLEFGKSASDATTLQISHDDVVRSFIAALSKGLKLLRAHEEQENELMLVAYWQDLGEQSE